MELALAYNVKNKINRRETVLTKAFDI